MRLTLGQPLIVAIYLEFEMSPPVLAAEWSQQGVEHSDWVAECGQYTTYQHDYCGAKSKKKALHSSIKTG